MAMQAIAYVKDLTVAPNGEKIKAHEKLILFVLADYYNASEGVAYPSVRTIAEKTCRSERRVREVLSDLQRKGVISRRRKWRGNRWNDTNEYRFPGLTSHLAGTATDSKGSTAKNDQKPLRPAAAKPRHEPMRRPTAPGGSSVARKHLTPAEEMRRQMGIDGGVQA